MRLQLTWTFISDLPNSYITIILMCYRTAHKARARLESTQELTTLNSSSSIMCDLRIHKPTFFG